MPTMKFNAQIAPPKTLTADHVVALNMRLFRHTKSLTMKQVGEQLEHFTGQSYTPQSISHWENTASRDKARPCSVQELVGLAQIFDVAVAMLVTVPDDDAWLKAPVKGVANSRARWLYQRFMGDIELAVTYEVQNPLMLSMSIAQKRSLKDILQEMP